MNSSEKARYIISNNWLLILSTADASGKPWVSPVGYAADTQFSLYWVSNPEAVHSVNIRGRQEVAIAIVGSLPDGKTDGVYYDATAKELNDKTEISLAIEVLQKRNQEDKFKIKSIDDVTGDAVWRIYKATPIKVYKRGDQTLKGQAITVREPVVL
jgi:nitroimidazol reductase NimA-like FMN-containing flavoprotein (pyridoxamine 5'-phosphate oxidase superfamily)